MEAALDNTAVPVTMQEAPAGQECAAPQGELETTIAQVWAEVFGREKIGRNANFFELGGNSLLGMDLTELLASRLGVQVPVLVLFQYPTIGEMAGIIADEAL